MAVAAYFSCEIRVCVSTYFSYFTLILCNLRDFQHVQLSSEFYMPEVFAG